MERYRVFLYALFDGRNDGIVLTTELDGVPEFDIRSFRSDFACLGELALNVGQVLLDLFQARHDLE